MVRSGSVKFKPLRPEASRFQVKDLRRSNVISQPLLDLPSFFSSNLNILLFRILSFGNNNNHH